MARIGDTVNAALGRTDYTPFLQGAQQGAAIDAQRTNAAMSQFQGAMQDIGDAKKKKAGALSFLKGVQAAAPEGRKQQIQTMIDQIETAPLMQAAAAGEKAEKFVSFMGDQMDRGMRESEFYRQLNADETNREYTDFLIESGKQKQATAAQAAPFLRDITERETRAKEMQAEASLLNASASLPQPLPEFNEQGVRPDPRTGQIEYASPALKELDTKMTADLAVRRESISDAEFEIQRLKAFKEQIETNGTGFWRWANTWGGNITAGSYEEGFMQLRAEMAAKLAKMNNGARVTDADVEMAKKALFTLSANKDVNINKVDELIHRIEETKKHVQAQEKYLQRNRTLLGFGENEKQLRESGGKMTPDEWMREHRQRQDQPQPQQAPAGNQYIPPAGLNIPPDPVGEGNLQSALPDPLKQYASTFIEAGKKHGVDPRFLAAVARLETGDGTSSAFRNKKNAMGVSNSKGPISFKSVEESIDRMARVLADPNGPYRGRDTVQEIASVYAPPGASNDPNQTNSYWPRGVSQFMQQLGLPANATVIQ